MVGRGGLAVALDELAAESPGTHHEVPQAAEPEGWRLFSGFGGRTNAETVAIVERPDYGREIRVEFMTTVNSYAPFEFAAEADSMTVTPGKMYFATFTAKNLTEDHKIAHAVPSVAPVSAAEHFVKIECFCFNSQDFQAGEEKAMPLQFIVNPDLPEYVDTITLGYTFFDTTEIASSSN